VSDLEGLTPWMRQAIASILPPTGMLGAVLLSVMTMS
jgi:hypothetical protein